MKTLLMALTTLAALMQPVLAQEVRSIGSTSMSLAIGPGPNPPVAPHHRMTRPPRLGEAHDDWRSIAASVQPIPALKLVAGYAARERSQAHLGGDTHAAWALGANYSIASGLFQLGYARNPSEGLLPIKKRLSIAYEYPLSRFATLYADASHNKAEHGVRQYRIGLRSSY